MNYESLVASLNNIDEAIILLDSNNVVIMVNEITKIVFGFIDEEIIGWKISDVLKENNHLVSAIYKIQESIYKLNDTILTIKNNETIKINFKIVKLSTDKGALGNILLLFQRIKDNDK